MYVSANCQDFGIPFTFIHNSDQKRLKNDWNRLHYVHNVTFRLCPAQNDGRIRNFGNMQRFRAWKHRDHACFRKIWIIRRLAYGRISRYRIFESYDGLSRKIELYDGIFAVIQSRFRKCTSEWYRDMLLIFGSKVCRWKFKNTPTYTDKDTPEMIRLSYCKGTTLFVCSMLS